MWLCYIQTCYIWDIPTYINSVYGISHIYYSYMSKYPQIITYNAILCLSYITNSISRSNIRSIAYSTCSIGKARCIRHLSKVSYYKLAPLYKL